MSTERKPVDVLAELRRQGVTGSVYYAVAELIEADCDYDSARMVLEVHYRDVAASGYIEARFFDGRTLADRFVQAAVRREKALAAVRGDAA